MLTGPVLKSTNRLPPGGPPSVARVGKHLVHPIDAQSEFQATDVGVQGLFDGRHGKRRAPGFRRHPLDDEGRQSCAFALPVDGWPVTAWQSRVDHGGDLAAIDLGESPLGRVATAQFGEHAVREGAAFALRRKAIPRRAFAQAHAVPRPCAKRAQGLVLEHRGTAGLRLADGVLEAGCGGVDVTDEFDAASARPRMAVVGKARLAQDVGDRHGLEVPELGWTGVVRLPCPSLS